MATGPELVEGVVYVVQSDNPYSSSFKKGDRVKLLAAPNANGSGAFQYEDGRQVNCRYLRADVLREAPKFKAATPDDLKPGAVFKVEDSEAYWCPIGSLVQHTGDFSASGARPQMEVITQKLRGHKQYVFMHNLSVVVEGKGDVVAPKPKKGTGKPVKTATRSDDYDFVLQDCSPAGYYVEAGCRWFTMAEAEKHWQDTRKGTDLGDETFDILNMFKRHITRLDAKKKR